ncbi:MAG: hypothetical protein ACRCTI_10970 [Beijerinckiaceae bacterium]
MPDNRQLPLDLTLEPRFGEEDFLVSGSNADAYAMIETWPNWPGRMLALVGPRASGKSHLGAIWAARSGARTVAARALGKAGLEALVSAGAVTIEDAGEGGMPEKEFFHLLNLVQEAGASLLVTSRYPPAEWKVATPDLLSRLRRMPAVAISEPDDALIRTLLVKLFLDRQIVVDTALIEYLAVRIGRSFAAVRETVAILDKETLARGKRLTRAMAGKILGFSESA